MSNSLADKPWVKSYDVHVPKHQESEDKALQDYLVESAAQYPNHPALVFKNNELTYKEVNALSDDVAAALVATGFKKGDRAVIYMPNTPQFVITFFGILKAGGIVIATNPLYSEPELEHQLHDCGAETVFVLSMFYDQLKRVQAGGKTNVSRIIVSNIKEYLPSFTKILFTLLKEKKDGHKVTLRDGDQGMQDFISLGKRSPRAKVTVTGSDHAALQYTGGTTGPSKGAIGIHSNIASNTYQMREWLPPSSQGKTTNVVLTAVPLFHSYGMIAALMLGVSTASTLILIPNPRDQKDLLGAIAKYKPTMFPGVPAMYNAINRNPEVVAGKHDLSSIEICLSGSAPLLLETKTTFEKITGATLVEGYGLSEAFVATHSNPFLGKNPEGSIGLPLPGVECRIVDSDDASKELGVGEVGELLLKGPTIMQGYWNRPEATENALIDGWLYTGDVVECDEDGYFYIRDRKKDMIIAGGYNIYPRELEEILIEHPDVEEVAIAGVPDALRGEAPKAWIVKSAGSTLTEQEIIDWSKERMAKYKYPRMIEFLDELPKSTVLKVLKRVLVKEHIETHGTMGNTK